MRRDTSFDTSSLVSIVTIVFNGEKYISECIESVRRQSYPTIEHIIIDGGSTDRTTEIVRNYQQHLKFWLSEKDDGLADAMNKSIKYCSGGYVLFLHADDKLMENAVEDLVMALEKSPKKWAMGFYKYLNSKGDIIKIDGVRQYSRYDMMLRNVIRHQATIVPKDVFQKIIFEKGYKYALDYMFFLKVWDALGSPEVVQKHLTYFRLDGNNLSSNFYASIKDEMKVRLKYRTSKGQILFIPFDYLIYFLRLLKIFFYHSRASNVG